jgi:hypothetical protein
MESSGQSIHGQLSLAQSIQTQKDDVEKAQVSQWLNQPMTRRVLQKLRLNQLYHLRQAASQAAHPGVNDLILRLSLTKASTMETIINKIEKGELDETSPI